MIFSLLCGNFTIFVDLSSYRNLNDVCGRDATIHTHTHTHTHTYIYIYKGKGKVHPRTGHEGPEGEQMNSFTFPKTSAQDGVRGQRHAPAALPPRKARYPLWSRLDGPQGRSGRVRKISPPPAFDPRTWLWFLLWAETCHNKSLQHAKDCSCDWPLLSSHLV
jgi:hypothetical protein